MVADIIRIELKTISNHKYLPSVGIISTKNPNTNQVDEIILPKNFNAFRASYCIKQLLTIYDPQYMDYDSKFKLGKWCVEHYEELKYFTRN